MLDEVLGDSCPTAESDQLGSSSTGCALISRAADKHRVKQPFGGTQNGPSTLDRSR